MQCPILLLLYYMPLIHFSNYDNVRSFISIFGVPGQEEVIIKLERSFKDYLKEQVDRETVERIVKY